MKTISVSETAYDRLVSWKTGREDTFSAVIERFIPPKGTLAGALAAAEVLPDLSAQEFVSGRSRERYKTETSTIMEVIADTTVLIDLWRYRKTPHRLADLTEKVGEAAILVPWITQAEFSRGALFKNVSMEMLKEFYGGFHLVPLDQGTIDSYCRLWGVMARAGRISDYPDLWIAACAVVKRMPLLTRNQKHFANIPDLEIIAYEIV